jgi:hypothetical protein
VGILCRVCGGGNRAGRVSAFDGGVGVGGDRRDMIPGLSFCDVRAGEGRRIICGVEGSMAVCCLGGMACGQDARVTW